MLNQADCIDKIRSSLFSCNKNDYVPTQEEIEIMTARYIFNFLKFFHLLCCNECLGIGV